MEGANDLNHYFQKKLDANVKKRAVYLETTKHYRQTQNRDIINHASTVHELRPHPFIKYTVSNKKLW